MAAVVPNQGQQFAGKACFKVNNATLRLFTNNITPSASSVIGDFTEAAVGGYAAKTLTPANWAVDSGGETTAPDQDFSATGADIVVYGWYLEVLDPENGTTPMVLAAERDANAPVTIPDGGVPYRVSPSFNIAGA